MDTTITQIYVIVLRLIHILGGVFWVGTALFLAGYLGPVIKASGPEGGKLMGKLATGPMKRALSIASGLTMLSGILLYAFNIARAGGFDWARTGVGIGFTIGGIAGIIGGIIGGAVVGRTSTAIATLGAELQESAGGPPPPDKVAEMAALQAKMEQWSNINAIVLTIAVIMMAIARYL